MKRFFHNQTILMKILRPIVAIMLLQALFFVGFLMHLVILPEARNNAYLVLNEQVASRSHYVESTMGYRWSNIDGFVEDIFDILEEVLQKEGSDYSELLVNQKLQDTFLLEIASEITYMFGKSEATGLFVILNNEERVNQQGIYIRNPDPVGYFGPREENTLLRGSQAVADKLKLDPHDVWTEYFSLGTIFDETEVEKIYSESYWSNLKHIEGTEDFSITYTVPITNSEGLNIGILGVDVSERYLRNQMLYEEIGSELTGIYILGILDETGQKVDIICNNGPIERMEQLNKDSVIISSMNYDGIYKINDEGRNLYGSVQYINPYGGSRKDESFQWVLIGMQDERDLLTFSYRLLELADIWIMITLVAGVLAIFFASKQISSSLGGVIENIRKLDPDEPVKLEKIGIDEIDELVSCIEYLSNEVAEASSKISKIIDITNVPMGIFEYNENDLDVVCSDNLYEIMGWSMGTAKKNYITKEFFRQQVELYQPYLLDYKDTDRVYKIPRVNGDQWIHVTTLKGNGKILGLVIDTTKDVEEKRRIEYERDYDVLTDSLNRRAFQNHLDELFTSTLKLKTAALIMCDLDNLKYINDTYGHEYGDSYIKIFSQGLKQFEKYNGVIGRRSGDEFIVFLHGFDTKQALLSVIYKVWRQIKTLSMLLPNGNPYMVRASGGIAWYPDSSNRWTALMQYADFAMYEVKHSVKGEIREFSREAYISHAYLLTGQEALNRLLDKEEILYAFQPILDVENENVFGYEMLMRSLIPELSTPKEIISMARSQSKLYQLERITWFKGMETFVTKIERGLIPSSRMVFINSIGSHSLNQEDIEALVSRFKPYLKNVVIELTESEPMGQAQVEFTTHLVEEWGSMLAIDDYGTGYNNTSLLLSVDPHIIKMDMSIIRNIHKDRNRQEMLETMVEYASERNIKILGEGVETKEEMEYLIKHGVSYLQGFYISTPNLDIEPISSKIFDEIHMIKEENKRNYGRMLDFM